MIKINLLKEDVLQRGGKRSPAVVIAAVLVFVIAAAGIAYVAFKGRGGKPAHTKTAIVENTNGSKPDSSHAQPETAKPSDTSAGTIETSGKTEDTTVAQKTSQIHPKTEEVPGEPPAVEKTPAAALPDSQKTKFTPSTHSSQAVVEEVVADHSNSSSSELVSLTYAEMSFGEKINYEIAFAKKVHELLIPAVPADIEFSTLFIDSFSVITATGIGPSKESVSRLFSSLRGQNFVIREKPASTIRPAGKQGYRFDFACDLQLGIDTSAGIATANFKPHESYSAIVRAFLKLAAGSGVSISNGLERTASQKKDGYRRYTCHLSGSATYRDFVKFVFSVYTQHLPCSFSAVRLKARSDNRVSIEADVVFTFLD